MTIRTLTAAVATSVCVLGSGAALGQAQRPQGQPSRPAGVPTEQSATDEIVVQGCLSRDASADSASAATAFLLRRTDGGPAAVPGGPPPPGGPASPGAPAQGPAGQHNAHAEAMQAKGAASAAGGTDGTYRLTAGATVDLASHLGHRIEVRGRVVGAGTGSPAGGPRQGGNQAVQGGQMQGVGQTMQSGQGGQSGQTTQPAPGSQPGQPTAAADGPAGAPAGQQTLAVTSVRMISSSCAAKP